jgi:Cyclopropane fatty acid synthase and related methyltransferases
MYSWRVTGIEAALSERGLSEGPLTVQDLTELGHLDQYHYYGTDACDEAISVLGLDESRQLLDIGSGIGGPARYAAAETGCHVHGIEIRPELAEAAQDLTGRVGVADRVRFTTGSINDVSLKANNYDNMIAWLVLLHLTDRPAVLAKCQNALRPGGTAFVEAFVTNDPSTRNLRRLQDIVEAPEPVSEATLRDEFRTAGFVDIVTCDLTDAWTRWTDIRYDQFQTRQQQFVDLHGREIYDHRVEFYRTVRDLFADGAVRGIRLTARAPGSNPLPLSNRQQTTLSDRDPAAILESADSD